MSKYKPRSSSPFSGQETRTTRFVCIGDTHNQTPQLPKGDVLIHAGDLTNQGTYTELQKTVSWLERQDFEVKIVVAGNHDITLNSDFYTENWSSFHSPKPGQQDHAACIALLEASPSITYLNHESTHITLSSPSGLKTHFNLFASPLSPSHGLWAFGYPSSQAGQLWNQIPGGTDVIVTHTPPAEMRDQIVTKGGRKGCPALRERIEEVKPKMVVCGHLHEGRGVERVFWGKNGEGEGRLEEWVDPGAGEGNRKMSLVDLTGRGRSAWVPSPSPSSSGGGDGKKKKDPAEKTARTDPKDRIAIDDDDESEENNSWTCIVNAAIMANSWGGPKKLNKPIVVDIELPVWKGEPETDDEGDG